MGHWLRQKLGLGGRGTGGARLALGAFGKHPGWPEHLEGYASEPAILKLKQALYEQGIRRNIDSGDWDRLGVDQMPFGHLLAGREGGMLTIARLWESADFKGRRRYPMVVGAACAGAPAGWLLAHVPMALATVQARCMEVAEQHPPVTQGGTEESRMQAEQKVGGVLAAAREEMASLAGGAVGRDEPKRPPLARLSEHRLFAGQPMELVKVMYAIEQQFRGFRPGTMRPDAQPQHVRVPAVDDDPATSIELWMDLLSEHVDPTAALWCIAAPGGACVDIIVGGLSSTTLYCLRAPPSALPIATQIPYVMDEPFIQRTMQAVQEASRPQAPAEALRQETSRRDGVDGRGHPPSKPRPSAARYVVMALGVLLATLLVCAVVLRPAASVPRRQAPVVTNGSDAQAPSDPRGSGSPSQLLAPAMAEVAAARQLSGARPELDAPVTALEQRGEQLLNAALALWTLEWKAENEAKIRQDYADLQQQVARLSADAHRLREESARESR